MHDRSENSSGHQWPPAFKHLPPHDQFSEWLADDPANVESFARMIAMAEQGDPQDQLPPHITKLCLNLVTQMRQRHAFNRVKKLFSELDAVLHPADDSLTPALQLARFQEILEELSDAFLELPESERDYYMKDLVPLRERARALKFSGS